MLYLILAGVLLAGFVIGYLYRSKEVAAYKKAAGIATAEYYAAQGLIHKLKSNGQQVIQGLDAALAKDEAGLRADVASVKTWL